MKMQCCLSVPISGSCTDEKLGSVSVGPSIGHGQAAHACVLELEVLVSKLFTINGFASSPIVVSEVSSLKKRTDGA